MNASPAPTVSTTSTRFTSGRSAIAEAVAGRPYVPPSAVVMTGQCGADAPAFAGLGQGPHWNGWGPDVHNTRYQPSSGGIDPSNVGRLRLKWAFGVADVTPLGLAFGVQEGGLQAGEGVADVEQGNLLRGLLGIGGGGLAAAGVMPVGKVGAPAAKAARKYAGVSKAPKEPASSWSRLVAEVSTPRGRSGRGCRVSTTTS